MEAASFHCKKPDLRVDASAQSVRQPAGFCTDPDLSSPARLDPLELVHRPEREARRAILCVDDAHAVSYRARTRADACLLWQPAKRHPPQRTKHPVHHFRF